MKPILGYRIRERRRQLKISQAELAKRVGISASYQNLIEHNKRSVGGSLLLRIATELNMQIEELSEVSEHRLLATLEEIAQKRDIASLGVDENKVGELIGRYPGWARAIAALARSENEANEKARALADRLTHDSFLGESVHRMLSSIACVRSAGEILLDNPEISKKNRDIFQGIIVKESQTLTNLGESLASYFDKSEDTQKVLTPLDEVEALFESRQNRFEEIEAIADTLVEDLDDPIPGTRNQKAMKMANQMFKQCITEIITDQPQIETELAQIQAEKALLAYAANALLAPMKVFLEQAKALKFDVEALAKSFLINTETVFHRLSALPRTEDLPCFGYYLANAAGTIINFRALPELISPRYASACPLWVLYRAQQSPQTILRQRALFPSGSKFVFLARTRQLGPSGFGQPRHYVTDMLAMNDQDAAYTVYATDNSVPLEPVGSTCRSCPRIDCLHRVSDPLTG